MSLRRGEWKAGLDGAVQAFRMASYSVGAATHIHTHMCFSAFNDIIDAVAAMDGDVISIETSHPRMEPPDAFVQFRYPNKIGPCVYDIHSPAHPVHRRDGRGAAQGPCGIARPVAVDNLDYRLKIRGW